MKKKKISDYQEYRTRYGQDGIEFPFQNLLNRDLNLKLHIPIPRKRLEEVLGISLDLKTEDGELHKDQLNLDHYIEDLMFEGLYKYSVRGDDHYNEKVGKICEDLVDIFEHFLQGERFQNFLRDHIQQPPYHKIDVEPPKDHKCIGCDEELREEHQKRLDQMNDKNLPPYK